MPIHPLSTGQLREALQLSEQIDVLQRRLHALLGGTGSSGPGSAKAAADHAPVRRKMSAAGRARIAAAVRARWAKIKGTPAPAKAASPKAEPKKQGGITPAGRAKLAAAMKARWAAKKKNGSS